MCTFTTILLLLSGLTACRGDDILGSPEGPVSNPPDATDAQTTDRLIRTQQPAVDVLFVVDNSCSMGPNQARMAAEFSNFMQPV